MSDDRQLINGRYFDFSSVAVELDGITLRDILSIEYTDSLTPQKVKSNSPMPRGRTRGDYEAQGSFTITRGEFQRFLDYAQTGFGELEFTVVVSYSDGDDPPRVDRLIGCRIVTPNNSHSAGGGALQVPLTLDVMRIEYDGKTLVDMNQDGG